jgi:branched-chain amino acid transport system permease protein
MLAMLLIGGEGTLVGPLFGVGVLVMLPTLFQSLAQFKTMGSGLLLILFSLYLPSGLYGGVILGLGRFRRWKGA